MRVWWDLTRLCSFGRKEEEDGRLHGVDAWNLCGELDYYVMCTWINFVTLESLANVVCPTMKLPWQGIIVFLCRRLGADMYRSSFISTHFFFSNILALGCPCMIWLNAGKLWMIINFLMNGSLLLTFFCGSCQVWLDATYLHFCAPSNFLLCKWKKKVMMEKCFSKEDDWSS